MSYCSLVSINTGSHCLEGPNGISKYFQIKASSKGLVMSRESVFENMGLNWFFYFGRILQEPEVHENQLK